MTTGSKVFETPFAGSDAAREHFGRKLSLETDPSDVYEDMRKGAAGFVLLDVRSPDAYAQSHAAGAVNIPHADITEARMAAFPPDTAFVVYCWGPGCNGADKAALRLAMLNRPVKVMIGGIEYWQVKEKLPVEKG